MLSIINLFWYVGLDDEDPVLSIEGKGICYWSLQDVALGQFATTCFNSNVRIELQEILDQPLFLLFTA
jgi:hypothetical protein